MKKTVIAVIFGILLSSFSYAEARGIVMSADSEQTLPGGVVDLQCTGEGEWQSPLTNAKIEIKNSGGESVVRREGMIIDGITASYDFVVPVDASAGNWSYKCTLRDRSGREKASAEFAVAEGQVVEPPVEPLPNDYVDATIPAHDNIVTYLGPATCVSCHQEEADEMLDSLHMTWSGATPDLVNTSGEELGKAKGGINTFCTYAVSSKGACYSCHVRADGNAPHPPERNDVDCLMCHSDIYKRKFVADIENPVVVLDAYGVTKEYIFGKVDSQGNYETVPDYDKMPEGTDIVNVARTVHLPTTKSCLRCHATAGGGDWTKRGDMGLSSSHATRDEDVHLAKDGADLSCTNCHSALNHKVAGRGIDLRQTETNVVTSCQACHDSTPHRNATLNNHAQGQVSCQVCHIREFAKGGETEIARDWRNPVWNPAFCSGQGGFVGEEHKEANVKPEYVLFDGTSYVYNVGETISPDERGIYPMAKAHGALFDGKSSIVPIKRHATIMPLHESGKIIPPAIMWMFMTGDFALAVRKGMEEQGMTGTYSLVEADAEMLITHGVDPKEKAPSCNECHDGSGDTPDGTGIIPFGRLGYHQIPESVHSCNLCHEPKNLKWEVMHTKHRQDNVSCTSCHTSEPTGFVQARNALCSSCHENKSWRSDEGHKKHFEKGLNCITCHTFG